MAALNHKGSLDEPERHESYDPSLDGRPTSHGEKSVLERASHLASDVKALSTHYVRDGIGTMDYLDQSIGHLLGPPVE